MTEQLLIGLASILVLGVIAQWIAWRLRLPSILLLLLFGFLAGPVSGHRFLNPDDLLGTLLFPIVSISVAVILFEGGLSLKVSDLRGVGSVVRNLVSIGALVTLAVTAVAAHYLLGLDIALALLLGAVLVVTGPTVIGPLLSYVRPVARVGSILRWEGIVIDPIGAMLAVLVFEAILAGGFEEASAVTIIGFLKTVSVGGVVGVFGAAVMIAMLLRNWITDYLLNSVTLMMVVAVFTASNILQHESGLLAVTIMGIALANQKFVTVHQILEFKENLRVLLISSLFIMLAARLQVEDLVHIRVSGLVFLGVLLFVARPLSVLVSTIGSGLNWREKVFLSWMAPRGIVAAAVASIFALRLAEIGHGGAETLVPLTFLVIVGTVAIYGLTAVPVARWLKVAQPNPQGVLIVGAHAWAREVARAIQDQGFRALLVDTNRANVEGARLEGLETYFGSILSEDALVEIDMSGIGYLLALTANDEANSLAALHFAGMLGRSSVFQLPPENQGEGKSSKVPKHLRGRLLFGNEMSYSYLTDRFGDGAILKGTRLSAEFTFDDFRVHYGEGAQPLFLVTERHELQVVTRNNPPRPAPGQTVIALVDPVEEEHPVGTVTETSTA